MKTRSFSWCLVLAVISILPAIALAGGAGTFRVGGVLGISTQAHGDINGTIDDTHEMWDYGCEADYYDECCFDANELGGGLVIGAQVEYLIRDNLGFGMEFLPLSSTGGWDAYFSDWDDYGAHLDDNTDLQATGKLVSAYGFYLMPMGDALSLRFGGGLGYILGGKLEFDELMHIEYDGEEDEASRQFEATGSGFGFHALVGAEYLIGDSYMIVGDAAYRVVKINELKVQDTSDSTSRGDWGGMEEGEVLQWVRDEEYGGGYFSTEDDGEKVGLDFGGLYLTLGVFYCF